MPKHIVSRLQDGFQRFGRTSHGFLTNEAVLIATESRTSSPVRIIRDKETFQHVSIIGLFPCGEGAGYAGGIVFCSNWMVNAVPRCVHPNIKAIS